MQVDTETDFIRTANEGHIVIDCPDCGEQVARGNLRPHRRGEGQFGCPNSMVQFCEGED